MDMMYRKPRVTIQDGAKQSRRRLAHQTRDRIDLTYINSLDQSFICFLRTYWPCSVTNGALTVRNLTLHISVPYIVRVVRSKVSYRSHCLTKLSMAD